MDNIDKLAQSDKELFQEKLSQAMAALENLREAAFEIKGRLLTKDAPSDKNYLHIDLIMAELNLLRKNTMKSDRGF